MKNHPPPKKDRTKTLSYAQARELKWFIENMTGLRHEYYDLFSKFGKLAEKLDRLDRTAQLIEKFLNERDLENEHTQMGDDSTRGSACPIIATTPASDTN